MVRACWAAAPTVWQRQWQSKVLSAFNDEGRQARVVTESRRRVVDNKLRERKLSSPVVLAAVSVCTQRVAEAPMADSTLTLVFSSTLK